MGQCISSSSSTTIITPSTPPNSTRIRTIYPHHRRSVSVISHNPDVQQQEQTNDTSITVIDEKEEEEEEQEQFLTPRYLSNTTQLTINTNSTQPITVLSVLIAINKNNENTTTQNPSRLKPLKLHKKSHIESFNKQIVAN